MSRDEMPKELLERIPHDVSLYVANFWRHPNDPERRYDFYNDTGDEFFDYLVHEDGPMQPENWGDIVVLLFARGCLKTTTCNMIMSWAADVYKNLEIIVTAPRREQTKEVMDRFKKSVEDSGLDQRRTVNQHTHQQFYTYYTDEHGNQRRAYNDVKSRSAWGEGDALRGIHAHIGIVDEFQDVDEGMFSVFKETVDRQVPGVPYFPTIFVIGTPKMANSFFDQLWQMSNQMEWDDDKKEWYSTNDAQEYLPPEVQERKVDLQNKVAELREMDGDFEEEIATIEEELATMVGFRVTGWHIDQYTCPRHRPADIAFKKATYTERKYKNEVLGLFYTPENDLLSDVHVHAAFDKSEGWRSRPLWQNTNTFVGVDWGGGDGEGASSTVLWVGEEDPVNPEKLHIRKVDFFPHDMTAEEELHRVEDAIIAYEPTYVVVDEGHGDKLRSNLQTGSGCQNPSGYDNVFGCHYGNVNNKDGITWATKGDRSYFSVNRTFMIESMVEDFKNGNIVIPAKDLDFGTRNATGTRLIRELTAPYTDAVETPDGKRKLKVLSDTHDDAFHALTFMWIAAKHLKSKRQLRTLHSDYMEGYDY